MVDVDDAARLLYALLHQVNQVRSAAQKFRLAVACKRLRGCFRFGDSFKSEWVQGSLLLTHVHGGYEAPGISEVQLLLP
jgi:hypothetical protein